MQLSPARGRLLNYSTLSLILPVDAAYPREGTVTTIEVILAPRSTDAA